MREALLPTGQDEEKGKGNGKGKGKPGGSTIHRMLFDVAEMIITSD